MALKNRIALFIDEELADSTIPRPDVGEETLKVVDSIFGQTLRAIGPDKGGERIANILTIIETAKLHGHNPPEIYLTDVLTRIQDHPKDHLQELLPWLWTPAMRGCVMARSRFI
ncbi:UNVERIFIED_ORG: hypothetical protein GGE64_006243 [Rhizobium etli]|uniref:Insertion sequence transposase protein n=1 Tax=Rhizobium etli (strain ATCC 51251 / DSM 11541 / JCM 21823 / NBRC 15573 / CFN 42) TaxID=347834 RepID=Q2K2K4_RHIEC|nr:putative insertion sequence transposase protein [Rhizobium etli CFN 42]MBB4421389.1 hypothetical protein [Rhizobium leguminosarum]